MEGGGGRRAAASGGRVQEAAKSMLKKKNYSLFSTIFKLLRKRIGNSIPNKTFLKVHKFCWQLPLCLLATNLATPIAVSPLSHMR
jgi:hypothetical protein